MREIIFDTETTGLDSQVDRVIEIGAVELENRFPTGRTFHEYIHPDGQPIHPEAEAVHGISLQMLEGKPVFAAVASDFSAFCDGAKLVAHNASFDIGFINAEFARCAMAPIDDGRVVDSLAIARRKHPMGPNSLDALCKRYGIDNSHRTKHGALLDAELLAEVYIEMRGGRQAALTLETALHGAAEEAGQRLDHAEIGARPRPLGTRLTDAERDAHRAFMTRLGDEPVWVRLGLVKPSG